MKTTHDLTEEILRRYFVQNGYTPAEIAVRLQQYRQLFADIMEPPKSLTDTEFTTRLQQATQGDTEFIVRLLNPRRGKPPSNLFGENN